MDIEIWTDGACSNNQSMDKTSVVGGWGVFLKFGEHEKELFGGVINTTNNRMELQACIEALKIIKNVDLSIKIYTDSQYVQQGISNWVIGWERNGWKTSSTPRKDVENQDLWQELLTLKRRCKNIEFIKVKGHSTNVNNNKADNLAQKGIDEIKKGVSE